MNATRKHNTSPGRIRVLVVDDHTAVRSALCALVSSCEDMQLVAEADNGADAIRLCTEFLPDVVLMDLLMPRVDGVSATRVIRQSCPETRVLAVTSFVNQSLVREALDAGAIGYVLKDATAAELAQAVRAARAGQGAVSDGSVAPHAAPSSLT